MKEKSSFLVSKTQRVHCADAALWLEVKKTIVPLSECKKSGASTKLQWPTHSASTPKQRPKSPNQKNPTNFSCWLDLHGLTHEQAYSRLKIFIFQANDQDIKCVWIITGKGVSVQPSYLTDRADQSDLLRTQVPRWLENFPGVKAIYPVTRHKGGQGTIEVRLLSLKKIEI